MRFRDTYGEVICDGNHSNVNSLNNLFMAKGRDYTIMITDALMVKGLPVGTKVLFGGNEIELYEDGSAHLTSTKGLAGSTLKVNMGLKVLVEKAMVPARAPLPRGMTSMRFRASSRRERSRSSISA